MKPIADDMVVYAAVVEAGSFTRAAKVVGMSKQAVSDRIARLEQHLGVRLLERTTRTLRPTDLGARYFEHSRAVAAIMSAGERELGRLKESPSGTLRLSIPSLYGRRFLAPVVSDLMLTYPDLRIEAILTDRYVDLVAEGFDAAVRVGIRNDSSVIARKLGSSNVHCVASPGFLAKHRVAEPASLTGLPCIGMQAKETWSIGTRSKCVVEPALVVNDLEVGLEAAIAGVGVARLPAFLLRPYTASGALSVLFDGLVVARRTLYAVYPSRELRSPALMAFLERIVAHFQPLLPLVAPAQRRSTRR